MKKENKECTTLTQHKLMNNQMIKNWLYCMWVDYIIFNYSFSSAYILFPLRPNEFL